MGLDIAFSRRQAIEAGIQIKRSWVDYTDLDGPAFEAESVRVPDMTHDDGEFWVENGGTQPPVGMPSHNGQAYDIEDHHIVVRANKWGHTYAPLTDWLKENGIKWSEF